MAAQAVYKSTSEKAATALARLGVSVLPVVCGDKKPSADWQQYQGRIMQESDIAVKFDGRELGVICGRVSGDLECLDFDDPQAFIDWCELVKSNGLDDVLEKCYRQRTPSGGTHVVYRVADCVDGNQKLARRHVKDSAAQKILIETRGEGGYFKCWPSVGYEPLCKPIETFRMLPVLDDTAHDLFLSLARALNELPPAVAEHTQVAAPGGTGRPGDDFNARADWESILEPYGWRKIGKRGERTDWTRPGKTKGLSATTGNGAQDYLYVFSSSTAFDTDRAYSKFSALTLLQFHGDVKRAAQWCAAQGYGEQRPQATYQCVAPPVEQEPVKPSPFVTDEEVADFDPCYVFEPYFLRSQLNLVDGRGGSRKSTFVLMVAAAGSVGKFPDGSSCEPFNTVFFGKEDDHGAYKQVYYAAGGKKGSLIFWDSRRHFDLSDRRCTDTLIEFVDAHNVGLVVFDPIKSYVGAIRNELDTIQVTTGLQTVRDAAMRTDAAWVVLSHWRKGADIKDMSSAHAGAEAWRNSVRSVVSVAKHPEDERVSCVFHTKGSILTATGAPLAFTKERGQYVYIPIDQVDLTPFGHGEKKSDVHYRGAKQTEIVEWLSSYVKGQARTVSSIREVATEKGYHMPQVYKARAALGLVETRIGTFKCWMEAAHEEADPFDY